MTDDIHNRAVQSNETPWTRGSNLGQLEQRVIYTEGRMSEIKDDIKELNSGIKELNKTIAGMYKPQYALMCTFAGLLFSMAAGLWFLAIKPLNDDISRLYAAALRTDTELKSKVNIVDILELKSDLKSRIEDLNARLKRQ